MNWNIPDFPINNPDCLIVISYACKKYEPVAPTRAIIEKACILHKQFPRAYVIMSTGDNQMIGKSNARIMAEYGEKIGIPRKYIIEEGSSRTTHENLQYCEDILKRKNLHRSMLLMLDLHARRTVAIARKRQWKKFGWMSVYSHGEPAYGYKWIQTYSRLTIFVYEIIASMYCLLRRQAASRDFI